ncbi:UNKNOWN [Stylonychia lemnae]|uniref:Uncharacterized protein n=1 Tax=Stylonychia lemnae TaxID=5949 RepID=A0A078B225_STYLE|nr:UNKNOWN [Stylonychia lemnae]|eukprot:CDW88600.1 UNKNOWN [Stylonychia lemnae]
MFLIRLVLLSSLLKSGLEMFLINKDTPELIITRVQYHLDFAQKYFYFDQDIVLRFVMNYQTYFGYFYGIIILRLSALSLFNIALTMKFLVGVIAFSIWFFYVDYTAYLIEKSRYQDTVTLIVIIAGLFMLIGYNDQPNLVKKTETKKEVVQQVKKQIEKSQEKTQQPKKQKVKSVDSAPSNNKQDKAKNKKK